MKKPAGMAVFVAAGILLLSACGQGGGDGEPGEASAGASGEWSAENATYIALDGGSATVDGTGASVDGGTVTITRGGTYVLSGTLEDGQIVVEAEKDDTVRLVLNGAEIASSTSAGIYAKKAGSTVLLLEEGTVNTVTDSGDYVYPDAGTDDPDAAVFAKNDLVITGTGTLVVQGNYNNGIGSKDNLLIESGDIQVTAVNHGIRGRDSLTVLDGVIAVEAGNDGLQSNNGSGEGKGWIMLQGGTYEITAGHDAVQAETSLTINGGVYQVLSGGGSGSDAVSDNEGSYKGLKAGTDLEILGGEFFIDSADDAIHANGNVTIHDGQFQLASGDDGIHADDTTTIHGGYIDISKSYEGIEGAVVEINGGEIHVVASDDGINAAGGTDSGGIGPGSRDNFASRDQYSINIHGGYITVDSGGDGIDSNGNVVMTGGTLLVNGPTRGGDAPLDFDGSFAFTGGTLVATGSSGMAQAPASVSGQAVLQVYFSTTYMAGTPVHVTDAQGGAIVTFVPGKEYQNLVVSVPEMAQGETYLVYTSGEAGNVDAYGFSQSSGYTPGELVVEVTLEEAVTRISDTGEAVSGGRMGGFGGGGGRGMGSMAPPDGAERQPPEIGEGGMQRPERGSGGGGEPTGEGRERPSGPPSS